MHRQGKQRLEYGAACIILLAVESGIALFVHDAFVRPYIGDVLVTWVLYTAVRVCKPDGWRWLPLPVFLFCAAVEAWQALDFVEKLGLGAVPFFRVLLGTTFDWSDIFCYLAGCILLGGYEAVRYRRSRLP